MGAEELSAAMLGKIGNGGGDAVVCPRVAGASFQSLPTAALPGKARQSVASGINPSIYNPRLLKRLGWANAMG